MEPIRSLRRESRAGGESADDGSGLIHFAGFYSLGCVMGFHPRQVDDMSIWEFMCCADGYAQANSPSEDALLTVGEIEALAASIDEPPIWVH